MGDTDLVVHCALADATDLLAGLEAAHIEYLDVDDERTIVIYQSAILMVVATDGDATAAEAFNVELWEPPLRERSREPEGVLQDFIEEFVTTLPTTQRTDWRS